jgi:hypothetical protein
MQNAAAPNPNYSWAETTVPFCHRVQAKKGLHPSLCQPFKYGAPLFPVHSISLPQGREDITAPLDLYRFPPCSLINLPQKTFGQAGASRHLDKARKQAIQFQEVENNQDQRVTAAALCD